MKLTKVLTVAEVAAIAGWRRRRMLRHLLRMNEQLHGMLLKNVGTEENPRYTVTLEALQRVAPQWFTDEETVNARLEALEEEVAQHRKLVQLQAAQINALKSTLAEVQRSKAAA